jgi:16S rRNA (adenine1518-N6/adenine1519-N6)-dimethyltransferase
MTIVQLPTSKRGWQALIRELGIRPSKGRGQNFLHDSGVVNRIVNAAGITGTDTVVEIGPGLGILTRRLAEVSRRVVAIEIDHTLARHLEQTFASSPSVEVVRADAMEVQLGLVTGGTPVSVVANLPYSAAAAIARHVLQSEGELISATLMLQREVGLRMLAEPPNMSILSVATQLYAAGSIAFEIPPDVFEPRPTVDSVVVRLTPHAVPPLPRDLRPEFFALVNAGFRHRRKNIANSLADETGLPKATINESLSEAVIDPTRRAQTLSVAEWLTLRTVWARRIGPIGQ